MICTQSLLLYASFLFFAAYGALHLLSYLLNLVVDAAFAFHKRRKK